MAGGLHHSHEDGGGVNPTERKAESGEQSSSSPSAWDYALVSVVDESPFVEEALWCKGDEGYELVSAYPIDGCVKLYFKRPV